MASPEPSLTVEVSESDHRQGPLTAPVTLVEYGDYECPYCGQAYPIIKAIQASMGDDLCFVFRNFPIETSHPHAKRAAEAAEAAGDQGAFWPMHDRLYEHQSHLETDDLLGYASALGLDTDRFASDLDHHTFADRVEADFSSGVRSGVNGTPTFFINGVRYDGPWDGETLLGELQAGVSAR